MRRSPTDERPQRVHPSFVALARVAEAQLQHGKAAGVQQQPGVLEPAYIAVVVAVASKGIGLQFLKRVFFKKLTKPFRFFLKSETVIHNCTHVELRDVGRQYGWHPQLRLSVSAPPQ